MKQFINDSIPLGQNDISAGVDPKFNDTVSDADVLLFQQEVEKTKAPSQSTFADQIIDKFGGFSEDIGIKKSAFEYKLARAARSGEAGDILEATRAMADYQLQVQVATKVASKANSSIEKISNLQ